MKKVVSIKNPLRGFEALDLDNPEYGAIRKVQAEHIKQLDSDMRETFSTDAGKRTLETLKGWTINRPACDPLSSERLDMFRSGQDDIVRCILAAIHNSGE